MQISDEMLENIEGEIFKVCGLEVDTESLKKILSGAIQSGEVVLRSEVDELVKTLSEMTDFAYAVWMVARADVEGEQTSAGIFNKNPSVIAARYIIHTKFKPKVGE